MNRNTSSNGTICVVCKRIGGWYGNWDAGTCLENGPDQVCPYCNKE